MTEITIDVSEEDFRGPLPESLLRIQKKAYEAYEAKKKEIKVGDFFSFRNEQGGIAIYKCVKQIGFDSIFKETNTTKLPDHLQKSLNEWMDSL